MRYKLRYKRAAVQELERLSPDVAERITSKIDRLADGLSGDVKRLTDYTAEYRPRVGDWRVLFNVEGDCVLIQHISHRSKAYD